MKELIGKEPGHLANECVQKLVGFLPGGIHGGIENAPLALDLIRSRPAGQFGIAHKPGGRVPRHIEFRNDANAALARIRDHAADFILGVVKPIRTHALQLGEFLALNPETLIFREMPVEYVQLHRRHAIQISLQDVERDKVAADINHQSTPGESADCLRSKLLAPRNPHP